MLKKTIRYKNFDDEMVEEDFYFNLTKAELTMMAAEGFGEDLGSRVRAMIEAKDGAGIIKAFVGILEKSYGVRSLDGKRFIKSPEVWTEFTQTQAYSDLVMEILTDAEKSIRFIEALIPEHVQKELKAQLGNPDQSSARSITEKKLEDYTQEELLSMSIEEFDRVCGTDPRKMTKDALVVAMSRRGK